MKRSQRKYGKQLDLRDRKENRQSTESSLTFLLIFLERMIALLNSSSSSSPSFRDEESVEDPSLHKVIKSSQWRIHL